MNFDKIYEYRFAGIAQEKRDEIWKVISQFIYQFCGSPKSVLDPAAGRGEFINNIPSQDCWAVDMMSENKSYYKDGINFINNDIFQVKMPEGKKFDLIFMSNFLEHLPSVFKVDELMATLHGLLNPGGKVVIMGPNFKYTYKEYYDCADHLLPLTHVSLAEILYSRGFVNLQIYPKFLPYSFRGKLPVHPVLVSLYLRMPWAWRFFGKQFLVIGEAKS